MEKDKYDIVIIGGGIYGSIAFNILSKCGYKVILLEKNDFGSGNTFATQRIIHGGLRYFQSFSLGRIISSLKARKLWSEQFPKYVNPLECNIPLGNNIIKVLGIKTATIIYKILELFLKCDTPGYDHPKVIKKVQNGKNEFYLQWYDGVCTDSERVIIELLKDGAFNLNKAYNYCEVTKIKFNKDKVELTYYDKYNEKVRSIEAKHLVNCTGLKLNKDLKFDNNIITKKYGFNFIINRKVDFARGEKYQGKYLFYTPFNNKSIIGTYWKNSEITKNDYKVFLKNINEAFNENLIESDIVKVISGFIPVKRNKELKSPFIERIKLNNNVVISIVGEKLTTAFLTMNKLFKRDFKAYGFGNIEIITNSIISKIDNMPIKDIDNLSPAIIFYYVRQEWARNVDDIIFRRTKLYLRKDVNEIKKILSEQFQKLTNPQ